MTLLRGAAGWPCWTIGTACAIVLFAAVLHAFSVTTSADAPHGAASQVSAEEELALRYNPIVKLTIQTRPCTKTGNVFEPAPVEIVLENQEVELRRLDGPRTVITTAPTTEDIAGLGPEHDINWPGNPRRPGCRYEQDYLRYKEELGLKPTAYAHVATEDGVPGIAVQYWYNYYYNDFANKHEGDWEMVQVMFDDANSVEEALQQGPTRTAYSGHAGGELASWTDSKLEKVGDRPVVYVTTGAHAAHYSEGTFIGVAKRGQVFGCDPTVGPHRTVDPEVVMLPDEPSTEGEFAWLTFAGLWGEESGPLFSGIEGPAVRHRWDEPFTWANGLRDFSDKIPDSILGVDPVGAICAFVNTGSDIMLFYYHYPWVVIGLTFTTMAALGVVLINGAPGWLTGRPAAAGEAVGTDKPTDWAFLRRERRLAQLGQGAVAIYARHWPLWMLIGSVMVPASVVLMFIEQLVGLEWLSDLAATTVIEPASEIIGMTAGALISAGLVSAGVFIALRELDAGNRPNVLSVYRLALRRTPAFAGQAVLYSVAIGLLSITIIGVPLAVNRAVSWAMSGQAVMFEDASAVRALRRSSVLTTGSWLRVLGTITLIALFVGLPGPVIAFGFLVFMKPPVMQIVYPLLSMLYVFVLFPLGFIASGLLYGDLCAVQERRASEPQND